MAAPQPTMFVTGPDSTLEVSDVYSNNDIGILNSDPTSSGDGFLSESNLPANNISDVANDAAIADGIKDGVSAAETIDTAKEATPKGASFKDIASKNKLADIINAGVRCKKHMGKRGFDAMNTGDFNFMIKEVKKFGNKMSSGSGLSLKDIQNAQGASDYAVIAAVGVLEIRRAMQPPNKGGIMGIIRRTSIPTILRDAAVESIMEIAAEYGVAGVAAAAIDLLESKLTKQKRKWTIEQLLRSFKFQTKPIFTTISKEEKKLIEAGSEYFGSGKKLAKALGGLTELLALDEEFPPKDKQKVAFVNALYKIDANWNSAYRNGERIHKLDLYSLASKDARESLLFDGRTREAMLISLTFRLTVTKWQPIAKKWYPLLRA